MQLTLGRTENVLDLQDIFENKKILLCNLSQRGRLDKSDAEMLGVLLLNEMFPYSLQRDENEAKSSGSASSHKQTFDTSRRLLPNSHRRTRLSQIMGFIILGFQAGLFTGY